MGALLYVAWERFCDFYGCIHKLWRKSDLDELTPFVNRDYYEGTKSPQMRADIVRLEILAKYGGLYLDCDLIWAGHSKASDAFVGLLNNAQFAVTASNDIRNATGRNLDLAVVFFTNRIIAAVPNQLVITRAIEIAKVRLKSYFTAVRDAIQKESIALPKPKPFEMTGPHVLNLALQEVGDSTPLQVIPSKWVYPDNLQDASQLVMFGHVKDRSVHSGGQIASIEGWTSKTWLMQRALPNYFTKARAPRSRHTLADYKIIPDIPGDEGAIAVFLHHNKAGGTGVKVALQQLYNITEGLTHVDVFSKSACAYSKIAVERSVSMKMSAICSSTRWKDLRVPPCGRCRAPGLISIKPDLSKSGTTNIRGEKPEFAKDWFNDFPPEKASSKCAKFKDDGKCSMPMLRGKCCASCGTVSCGAVGSGKSKQIRGPKGEGSRNDVPKELTPAGQYGQAATKKCIEWKAQGLCNDPRLRGYCCVTCGNATCGAPNTFVGDYVMGLCNILPPGRHCAYYTMLREPRARVASSYLHCQYEPDDQLCMTHVLDARKATFPEWVRHQGNYLLLQLTFDLSQALSIEEQYEMYLKYSRHRREVEKMKRNGAWIAPNPVGDGGSSSVDEEQEFDLLSFKPNMLWLIEQSRTAPLGKDEIESVVGLLEYTFAVIGITERFDESLELYEATFGLKFPEAAAQKSKKQAEHQLHVHEGEDINRRRSVQENLLAQFDYHPELNEYISADLALYKKALSIFDRQMEVFKRTRATSKTTRRKDDKLSPDHLDQSEDSFISEEFVSGTAKDMGWLSKAKKMVIDSFSFGGDKKADMKSLYELEADVFVNSVSEEEASLAEQSKNLHVVQKQVTEDVVSSAHIEAVTNVGGATAGSHDYSLTAVGDSKQVEVEAIEDVTDEEGKNGDLDGELLLAATLEEVVVAREELPSPRF